jgi:hypothetical protein
MEQARRLDKLVSPNKKELNFELILKHNVMFEALRSSPHRAGAPTESDFWSAAKNGRALYSGGKQPDATCSL